MGIIYQNPSLVEVICELQWELTPVVMPPGSAVDPFFDVVRADLTGRLASQGFANVQELAPSQAPKQLFAWQPLVRYAPAADKWPKIQLGPGVFSVNMSGPEYTGWPDFAPTVRVAVQALLQSFPNPERFLKLRAIQLKYLNGFTKQHNFRSYSQFTTEYLGLKSVLPDTFLDRLHTSASAVSTNAQSKFSINTPSDSHILMQVAEADINKSPGCMLQLVVERTADIQVGNILSWFDQANLAARGAFESLVTRQLVDLMRPREKK
ncbi:TIGR04255 family protein [Burkholderia sp. AU45274]|uniref:TIGR04255 family protein n=1 Tax=Burkholderia sp. AU45274 TaxID=3059205 RepID=UPI00264C7CDB|nr:TIGR04255 family protein [Burkholderia sp. AU45274]MDN7492546.1 TIGR04255 family protein [Burkholderia sp. AU45274]